MPEMWEVLPRERDSLKVEIYEAFCDVNREGGVSYREAGVLDWGGTEVERAEARAWDTESHWTELVDDRTVIVECDACWFFLDPIGFRYYLPVALIRSLYYNRAQHSRDYGIQFHLTLSEDRRERFLHKWSLLDLRQRRCIRRFIKYMIAYHKNDGGSEWEGWQASLDSYWCTVE